MSIYGLTLILLNRSIVHVEEKMNECSRKKCDIRLVYDVKYIEN